VLAKILRALVDPSVAAVRALPREDRELFIAAKNGHVLAFTGGLRGPFIAAGWSTIPTGDLSTCR
jgi:hypothetical protein